MSRDMTRLIDSLAGPRVLVVGDAMLDYYLEGTTGRVCQEAPVPIVDVARQRELPGGAANTAANLARLGGRASLLSAVGDDLEGGLLRGAMAWCGIDRASLLVEPSRHTPTKHRVVLGAQILVRYDQGDTGPLGIATESTVFDRLSACWSESDAVVISGYGYGILTPRAITQLKRLQAKSPRVLVVDSKDLTPYRTCGPTVVKPKHTEAICLLGLPGAILEGSRAERMA